MWKILPPEEREKFNWEKYEQSSEFLHMKRSADNGDIESQRSLGFYYDDKAFRSDEMDKSDKDKSVKYFTLAANSNDAEACFRLGELFEDGYDYYINGKLSLNYYTKATVLGHAGAMCSLAIIYERGWVGLECSENKYYVTENWSEAIRLYNESAKRGYANAHSCLAEIYLDGKLLPQDLNKALLHEKKAIKLFQHLPESDDWYDVWEYDEWLLLGDIYMAMGNTNEARQAYLKGKDKDTDCKERLEELKNKR